MRSERGNVKMKSNKIILDDEYFIEVDELNWTLKKKRASTKSKSKVLGYYGNLEKALLSYKDELINKACLERDRAILLDEVIKLLHKIENRLNHTISTLKMQSGGSD